MSPKLISHSPDLKQLWDDGYEIEILRGSHLLIHNVPYVKENREVAFGTLITTLELQDDTKTSKPGDHVIHFNGEYPCSNEGVRLTNLVHQSTNQILIDDMVANHSFSHKPKHGQGYSDYHEKVTTYVQILSSHAEAIDDTATARTFRRIDDNSDQSIFSYPDTNSGRTGISKLSEVFKDQKVAIVGVGGTGSYVLDFVSKTPVKEIHLYDNDTLLVHNAFRSPGAASVEELRQRPSKVGYHTNRYSNMHRGIIAHGINIDDTNLDELAAYNFVFLCIDTGPLKKKIVEKLIDIKVPFVDVGIGMQNVDSKLRGTLRTTLVSADRNKHAYQQIGFAADPENDYAKNIQIAEINALNAALAVIKWKKHLGYYHDFNDDYSNVYHIDVSQLVNE